MYAMDSWHVESRSLTTRNFNIRFFSPFFSLFFKCKVSKQKGMISDSNCVREILILYCSVVLLPVIEFKAQLPLCIKRDAKSMNLTASKQFFTCKTFLLALKGLELKDLFTKLRFEISNFV